MSKQRKSPRKAIHSVGRFRAGEPAKGLKRPEISTTDKPVRSRPLDEIFVRGLIEVQFNESTESGLETWKFEEEQQREKLYKGWSHRLKEILRQNGLVSWKPVFPLRYPWSTAKSKDSALASYIEAGKDRYVCFDFTRGADVVSIAKALREVPELEQAVPVPEITAPAAPLTEPLIGRSDHTVASSHQEDPRDQWYLFRCEVPEAWNLEASGRGVVIADIDWGFDRNHQDLISRIGLARSMFGNPDIVSHGNMRHHGTAVLGLAGAGVNDRGMAGIAYDATLWAIQAGSDNILDEKLWVAAIDFVRSSPGTARKVIILEAQTTGLSNIEAIASIRIEIIAAINEGIVVCVPAGNGNATGRASIDDANQLIEKTGSILVGATKFHPHKNERADSNGDDRVVVYAPGDMNSDLTCGSPPDRYRLRFGGTSSATAKVAGVVALMLEKNDQLTPQKIREILQNSQKEVVDQFDRRVGVLLDAHQAVSEAMA